MDITGSLELSGPLDFGGGNALGMEDGLLNFQGSDRFAFANTDNGQQVNFNVTSGGSLGLSDQFGSSAVLQVGSAVHSGGLVIQSGGDDFVLGVGDQEDGQYGDYVDLDEEIYQLQGIDLEVSTVPLFNYRAGARGVSLENAGVFALSTGIQAPPLHAAALCSDDYADGSLFALGRTDIFSSATVLSVQANGQAMWVTSGKRDGRYGQLVHDFSYETSGLYNAGIRSDCDGPYSPRGVYGAYQNYGSYGGTPTGDAMGVRGYTGDSGTNRYGVFSSGNFGCSGENYFLQPHPTDPSKQVRFACLEGNESGTSFPLNPESTYPVP